jgi:hypothetical protein
MQLTTPLPAKQVLQELPPLELPPRHLQAQRVIPTVTALLLEQPAPQHAELPPRLEPAHLSRFSWALAQWRPRASWVRAPAALLQ